jgi:hypothetical protein
MAGEAPTPKLPLVGTVKDFGAIGDGVADDTQVCCVGVMQLLHKVDSFMTRRQAESQGLVIALQKL